MFKKKIGVEELLERDGACGWIETEPQLELVCKNALIAVDCVYIDTRVLKQRHNGDEDMFCRLLGHVREGGQAYITGDDGQKTTWQRDIENKLNWHKDANPASSNTISEVAAIYYVVK